MSNHADSLSWSRVGILIVVAVFRSSARWYSGRSAGWPYSPVQGAVHLI